MAIPQARGIKTQCLRELAGVDKKASWKLLTVETTALLGGVFISLMVTHAYPYKRIKIELYLWSVSLLIAALHASDYEVYDLSDLENAIVELSSSDLNFKEFRALLVQHSETFDAYQIDRLIDGIVDNCLRKNATPKAVAFDKAFFALRSQKLWSRIVQLYRDYSHIDITTVPALLAVTIAYEKIGAYDQALTVTGKALTLPNANLAIKRRHYRLLKQMSNHVEAERFFETLSASESAQDVVTIIGDLRGVAYSDKEVEFLIGSLSEPLNERAYYRIAQTLAAAGVSTHWQDSIDAIARKIPADSALRMIGAMSAARDKADIERLALEPLTIGNFSARRDALRQQQSSIITSDTFSSSVEDVFARHEGAYLLSEESYFDALSVADYLRNRIAQKEPTLMLRLGDGEGAFMRAYKQTPNAQDISEHASIQQRWWRSALDSDAAQRVAGQFSDALAHADIIGVPPFWRMAQRFAGVSGQSMRENLSYNFELLAGAERATSPVYCSAHANTDLQKWNLWRYVLNPVSKISYIACHDIDGYLTDTFGIAVRQKILVPPVARFAELFGSHGPADVWLKDMHADITAKIDARPGEVWIVAAGFLGKIYGKIIRDAGGIALDMGALTDYWSDYVTRSFSGDETVHNLPLSLVPERKNYPWTDRPGVVLPEAGAQKSTLYFDYVNTVDAHVVQPEPTPKLFKIIGHPRCASGFIALTFRNFGYDVGHERLEGDGISSWMLAVQDQHVPFGDVPAANQKFEHLLAYTRDPYQAVPSIILENGMPKSFMFRRLHLLQLTGVDLAEYATPLERAVASLVYWQEHVESWQPSFTIRVEDAQVQIEQFLKLNSITQRAVSEGNRVEAHGYNSSFQKFGIQKPKVEADSYAAIDSDLKKKLADYCDRYGYSRLT